MTPGIKLVGGIEAGGTKFVCAIAGGPLDIRAQTRIETTTPDETLDGVIDFFKAQMVKMPVEAIGIGSFGPVGLDPALATYGFITTTPKPHWAGTNLKGRIEQALGVPVKIDTDTNTAALGEGCWGSARGLHDYVYVTVGTGIGGGAVAGGRIIHGLVHAEMGHMLMQHDRVRDPFEGACPFHRDCWEGLACGPAIQKRWGKAAQDLPDGHPAWELEADYLAQGLINITCVLSPQRIIVGGGVVKKNGLLSRVREIVQNRLNRYIDSVQINENIENYIVAPGLGARAGVLGAIALAQSLEPGKSE
jgi:fructokinase